MTSSDASARALIVNADDFGQSPGINAGIIKTHRDGIVTSASLMVRWPAAPAAAAYARCHPDLSVGLHVDLGEWSQVGAEWFPRYEVIDKTDRKAVEDEILRQLDMFRTLMGRDPTHLDGHQHVQRSGHPGEILGEQAARLGVFLRGSSPAISYVGGFYGRSGSGVPYPDGVRAERLLQLIENLPPGLSELGCHPGLGTDLESDYVDERILEVKALCDPRVRRAIEQLGIELRSFASVVGCG